MRTRSVLSMRLVVESKDQGDIIELAGLIMSASLPPHHLWGGKSKMLKELAELESLSIRPHYEEDE